jgi:hypothetical protein
LPCFLWVVILGASVTTTLADKTAPSAAHPGMDENGAPGNALVAVPLPVVDPTFGSGVAPLLLYTFAREGEPAGAPRSTLGVAGAYTDNGTWLVAGGFKLNLAQDEYRVGMNAAYGALALKYFGTSSDSYFFDNPVSFTVRGGTVGATVEKALGRDWYLGVSGRLLHADLGLERVIDLTPTSSADFRLLGIGVLGTRDTRDNTWFPVSGSLAITQLTHFSSHLGRDSNFLKLDARYARYKRLDERLVLALDGRLAEAGGSAPFFLLPFVSFRGFPAGRYLGESVVQAQGELRFLVRDRLGVVAFVGAGIAADSLSRLGEGSEAYGLGAGLRYQVSRADRMNVGLDAAYGSSDDVTVYFRLGEAF